MKKIIVICPGGASTGGIELLHQLVDAINSIQERASICYYPFNKKFTISPAYEKYKCPVINFEKIQKNEYYIILPEVYTYLLTNFKLENVYLWWMSVDNYKNSSSWKFALKNKFLPWDYLDVNKKSVHFKNIGGHLCQSEYARKFLESYGMESIFGVSDYINEDYVSRSLNVDYKSKKDIVVFNPAKGIEQTKKIRNVLKDVEFRAILNMSRSQVMDLLQSAKIYIDFGNHPGKDRIPREAAALGCCVITNRRGSAGNSVDIPISDRFKIDDECKNFANEVASVVGDVFTNFDGCRLKFDLYRSMISSEKKLFKTAVENLSTKVFLV